MKPILGFPRLVLFDGNWSHSFTLEDVRSHLIAKHTLKYWKNALLITENEHCFKIEDIQVTKILTPWFLRGWKEPTYVEFDCKTRYCPHLSLSAVYPIIWRSIDIATSGFVVLREPGTLGVFTTAQTRPGYCDGGFISARMKKRLKKLIEQRVSLRIFFEAYVNMLTNHGINSSYL